MPIPRPIITSIRTLPQQHLARQTQTASSTASSSVVLRSSQSPQQHQFSTTSPARAAHEDHYDPPSGWLWGVKPGEKAEKEGWENLFFYGFYGGLGVGVVAYAFKPDTSIQTWALEEARRRLEVEGILKEPETKS